MNEYVSPWHRPYNHEEHQTKETVRYSAPRLEARGNELVVVRSK